MGKILKRLRKLRLTVLLLLVFAAALCFRAAASHLGTAMGDSSGTAVGLAIGSYHGITEGISTGAADGHEAGLSAEDTTAVIQSDFAETGRLQVLAAGVKLANQHTVGNNYSALYILKGSAVFTVDLEQAAVLVDGTDVSVTCPEPEVSVYIDENETQKLAEYQKHRFAGSTEDGFQAYLNTMTQSVKEVRKSISNYDNLMKQAKEAAVRQVGTLVRSVRGTSGAVSISFA